MRASHTRRGRLGATDRRRQIVEAAIRRFSAKGFRGTTTRELAREAGISEALLFRHFPTKKKLYEAILEAKMEERFPRLLEGLPMAAPPRRFLFEVARRIVAQNEKDPTLIRLFLFSALEGHGLSDLFFKRRTLPLLQLLSTYLKDQTKAGRLRRLDEATAARAFLGLVFNLVQTRLLFRIPAVIRRPPETILRDYVEIYLKGLER